MSDFHERLASMCAKEMATARKAGDAERMAEVVSSLTSTLGKTIAMAASGDPRGIETLLTGCEHQMASEAADFAPLIALQERRWRRPAPPAAMKDGG